MEELLKLYERPEGSCDKNCENCDMFLPQDEMCFHEWHKKWQKWNEAEHKRFGEMLKKGV